MSLGEWCGHPVYLDERFTAEKSKPTIVERGLMHGYSLPIWSVVHPDEEIYFRQRIPCHWENGKHPFFHFITYLDQNEAADSTFATQLEVQYAAAPGGHVNTTIDHTIQTENNIGTHNAIGDTHMLSFELPYPETLNPDYNIQYRIRRVASSGTEIAGEIVVMHWDTVWFLTEPYKTICEYMTVFS